MGEGTAKGRNTLDEDVSKVNQFLESFESAELLLRGSLFYRK